MARRKPGSLKALSGDFKSRLDDEARLGSSQRYTSTNEQQSDLLPSRAPSSSPAPRARPAAAAQAPRRTAPTPPRRPPARPPRGKEGWPTQPPEGPPYIPGTPPLGPPPFQMPQYDPLGNPSGPAGPGVPAATPMGYPPVPQPTDMVPPMAGPGSDRMSAAVGPTQLGGLGSLPEGQSAASMLLGSPQARFDNPMGSPITPPGGGVPAGPGAGPVMPPPMAGPGSDRTPPPGLLEGLGNYWQGMKRGFMGG
jgi:hypothetical protein